MGGLSDVRLTLSQQELLAAGEPLRLVPAPQEGQAQRRWKAFWRRLSTRRALLELDDAQLRDIGLTRAQARQEALRPFWTL
ncbi:DUF1127 domain-containing protein [Pseudomonas sp. LPB0260]|uniref:DUF1127 domain-containing protein n=1 Tax=Pseudomonas sp. LPB0260 TaxID=2614442 RepID=UPI0015C24455|nr:DUF1127 domain-containing protein [Pseudomonas sp. LPB0260]QLC77496.1 DUF1127 domain-containing protein [Pseudomonas sp. LPB0260]QLC77626.1 DUF1127 domain-containing protein [Pseudomonas sp. LPB0260]